MRGFCMALTLILMGAAALVPSSARAQRRQPAAQEEEEAPSAEARTAAREAYTRGQEQMQGGDFMAAEAAFREAYAAVPNPVVLLSIGASQERLGNASGAVETYERYLAERDDAPDRDVIEAKMAELRAMPAVLVVSSTPVGATIVVDGEEQGEVTPAEIEVAPGEHTIGISLDGYDESRETIDVGFGDRHELAPVLAEAEPTGDEFGEEGEGAEYEEEEETEAEGDEGGVSAGVWVSAAMAGVGLITGTVLGFLALSEQSEFDDTPTEKIADDGETFALFADVAFGVAIVGAITAVVLYLTDSGGDDDADEDDASATLRVAPAIGAHGGGVAASMTF